MNRLAGKQIHFRGSRLGSLLTSIIDNLQLVITGELSEIFHGAGLGPLLKIMAVKITKLFFRLPH